MTLPDPLGQDLSLLHELTFRPQDGIDNLLEALGRRLITPRGGLWYAPNYGLDIRQFINESISDGGYEMSALIEGELEGDERVLNATVTVDVLTLDTITFQATIETLQGPFQLIGTADSARGVILSAEPDRLTSP